MDKSESSTARQGISRRDLLKTAGLLAGSMVPIGAGADTQSERTGKLKPRKKIKIAFIGGGSQTWAPNIIRDITCKPGLENVEMEIALVEIHMGRAQAIHDLFRVKFAEWEFGDRVRTYPTLDPEEGLADADFVLIAISTGRLPAMAHDLSIPEDYGIYQTVGDTTGPGGWARNLRNFAVFDAYARQTRRLAPDAVVLNYTNPLAALTALLANELGPHRVVGLCHGLFENYEAIMRIFDLESEDQIKVRFGGVNHFFWVLDFTVDGRPGYPMLAGKLRGRRLVDLLPVHGDALGFVSNRLLASELLENYELLPYIGDRHTCEFFGCYINNKQAMEKFRLVRTTIPQREEMYAAAEKRIREWTDSPGGLTRNPSREAAADIIKAVVYDEPYTDVVNLVNSGQITNLPSGAVVETLGQVSALGFTPFTVGPLPDRVKAVVGPHAEVQLRLVEAYLSQNKDEALMALAAEPACSHLTASDSKRMGRELLAAHREFLPEFLRA